MYPPAQQWSIDFHEACAAIKVGNPHLKLAACGRFAADDVRSFLV
jgi:hypothetical protein